MRLLSFGARHFRNLEEFAVEPHPRFNIFEGANAQGKTNLLELIFVLASLKSFRTSALQDLVRFDADLAVVSAALERRDVRHDVRLELRASQRRTWVDERLVRRASDYLGSVQAVLFAPEDVSLFKEGPGPRRTFIDRAVFNSRAAFLEDVNGYQQVLRQRNALLRDEHPRRDLLDVFDEQLVAAAARVLAGRLSYLSAFRAYFCSAFEEIFGAHLPVQLLYQPSWCDRIDLDDPPSLAEIVARLEAALTVRRREELRRGQTLVGPHRDDLVVMLDGRDARLHASQGQHRTLVLALKVSEITHLRERFDLEPVLLLDDVSSELDRRRNEQLLEFLGTFEGQVFVTTTSREYVRIHRDVRCWTVSRGTLTPSS